MRKNKTYLVEEMCLKVNIANTTVMRVLGILNAYKKQGPDAQDEWCQNDKEVFDRPDVALHVNSRR